MLILAYLGLLKDFLLTNPFLWFLLSASTTAVCSFLHLAGNRKHFSLEFLFSVALLYAGTIYWLNLGWLKLIYFPFVISMTFFYGWATIIPLSFLVAMVELKTFLAQKLPVEEVMFSASLILTSALSSVIFSKFRKDKDAAVAALKTIKETTKGTSPDTAMESLSGDDTISHYFASMIKTDAEIKELLLTIKHAVFADYVNFFIPKHGDYALRCSTGEKGEVIVNAKGISIIPMCIKEKKSFYCGAANEKRIEIGYIRKGEITSILIIPVMDGPSLVGVLTVDSSRYSVFNEPEKKTIQMFAAHLARILERERIYPRIKRDYNGLKILNEESSMLVSSLNMDVIAKKLCEGAKRIAASEAFLFIKKGREFELIHHTYRIPEGKTQYILEGTAVNFAVEERQPRYLSDATHYPIPIMPFKVEECHSFLAIPMFYENNLLGLFVMLSRKKGFLDVLQQELLRVMCNQAATSIANAKLHAEIEQMAITDGLTGLYNHRAFQEKLADELKRQKRSLESNALLLMDIDFFKKVNDTYGHPAGDLVLKGVAKIIRGTIRDIDIPARYGGEEFAVVLPQTDGKGAKNFAERLRKTVMHTSFSADGAALRVTLSIGIATSPADAKGKEELIEKSDQALYYVKHNGRNQTALWSDIGK